MITLKKKKRSLWQRIKECFLIDKDKCFEENKNEKGICYGLYGGDKWSEYHCYQCMDCPHLTIYMKNAETNSCITEMKL